MSINATVQRIVDDLFADKLIRGLEATEKIKWIVKDNLAYDPLTGEVSQNENETEIPVITGDMQSSFPGAVKNSETLGTLQATDDLVLQMQPLENRTSKQALADYFIHEDREYAVKRIDVIRLGNKPMLWKVRGS